MWVEIGCFVKDIIVCGYWFTEIDAKVWKIDEIGTRVSESGLTMRDFEIAQRCRDIELWVLFYRDRASRDSKNKPKLKSTLVRSKTRISVSPQNTVIPTHNLSNI